MTTAQLWSNSDEYLRVSDLYDPASSTRFFMAQVWATLRTSRGAEVVGLTWPQTLYRVPGVQGAFRGMKLGGLSLLRSETYTVDIRAESGPTTARWIMTRTPSLKYASNTTTMLRMSVVNDIPDTFGQIVVGQIQMVLTEFNDTADTFGTVTIG